MIARLAPSSLLALSLLAPLAASAEFSISIGIAPPPLPVYQQPPAPGDGYLWTPGYWAWNEAGGGYYWVPGTWVLAPRPGYLWTPGYWRFVGATYRWSPGYWGPRVGFYGGIDYGFGYTGHGYYGGRWDGGAFHYNTAVNNVNTTVVRNVYRTEVVHNTYNVKRVSYNGGAGVKAEATTEERQARQAQVVEATPNQVEHERKALEEPAQKASATGGAPRVVATTKATSALDAPDAVRGNDPGADKQKSGQRDARRAEDNSSAGKSAAPQKSNPAAKARARDDSTAGTKNKERDANAAPAPRAAPDAEEAPAQRSAARKPSERPQARAPAKADDNGVSHDARPALQSHSARAPKPPPAAGSNGERDASRSSDERVAQTRAERQSEPAAPAARADRSEKDKNRE